MRDRLRLLSKISTLVLILVGCALKGHAQSYPVQVTVALAPPYSPFLQDYSQPGSQKFTTTILLRHLNITDYKAKLRLTIEGVGITIRTKANYVPLRPITLNGGETLTLYGEDLEEYFNPNNLDFAGISKNQYEKGAKLPDGVYRFSVEVLDYNRSSVVSNKGTAVAWVILNDPPLLNLPRNGDKGKITEVTNIPFTWTSRHTGSPNSSFSCEYVFRLVEIWPASRNPYDAFLSQQPLYEITTTATQIVYGPAEPALIPGRKYAWQVQAKDTEGRDLFKNEGKSEVYTFQFGDEIGAPQNFRKDGGNASVINLRWEPAPDGAIPQQYRVRYRKKNNRDRDVWYESVTPQLWIAIPDLQRDTEYEMQIRAEAAPQYSEYSQSATFKTSASEPVLYECGKEDVLIPVSTSSVLMSLPPGTILTAAGDKIQVIQATGSNGNFTGEGWMHLSYLKGAGVRITFSGQVNNDYEFTTLAFETVYNKGSVMAQAVDDAHNIGNDTNEFFDEKDSTAIVKPDYTVPGTIDSIYVKDDGKIVVVDTEGNESTFEPKKDEKTGKAKATVVADASGNSYTVDEKGKVSKNPSTGTNTNNGNAVQPDEIKDRIVVLILEEFESQINAWLRNNGKGGDVDEDVLLAAELPTCFPRDADILKSVRDNEIKYYKDKENAFKLRGKIEKSNEANVQLFSDFKALFSAAKDVELDKLPVEKREQVTNDACNALMEGKETDITPLTEKIKARLNEIRESTGKQLQAILYCKSCTGSPKEIQKSFNKDVFVLRTQKTFCLGLVYEQGANGLDIEPQELSIDNQTSVGNLEVVLPVLGANNEQTFGFFTSQENYQSCSAYLDQNFFSRFDYCKDEPTEALYENLTASLAKCINDSKQVSANSDGFISDEIIEAVDKTLAGRLGDERFKVVFTASSNSNTDNTAKKKELGEQTNPTVTISYTKVADKEWKISATLSEEYKQKLAAMPYFKKYKGNVLDDLISAIDEVMLNAQVKFCGSGDIGPNCVSEELRLLQVLCLNIESVGQTGVLHESMWHSTDPKRDLLPPNAKWHPAVGGVVDELVEEATSIPMLVKTIGEVCFDDEKKQQLTGLFSEKGYHLMQDAVFASFGSMLGDDSDVRYYKAARYTVMLAFLYYAIAEGVSKSLDDALKQAAELTNKVENAPALRNYLAEVAKLERKGVSQTKQLKELVDEIGVDKLEAIVKKADPDKVKDILEDIAGNKTLRDALASRPELAGGWMTMYKALGRTSQFAKDIPTLERIVQLSHEGSAFRTKLGDQWSEALDDILKTAKDLKCSTCTSGRVGRSNMDQFLTDAEHFIANFNISAGGKGEVFYNWMRGKTKSGTVPGDNLLDEVHQTLRDFAKRDIKESNLRGLSERFRLGNKEYDVWLINNKYIEYKNKDFVSKSLTSGSGDVDQFINGYLRNIKSLDDLEWKVGFDKLKTGWGTPENALVQMKKQWKKVFEEKTDDIFEVIFENEDLANSLFGGLASSKPKAKALFNKLINENDDKLFQFIKIE